MRAQSVSSAVRARAWQAAIAACSAYGPRAPPSCLARARAPPARGGSAADPSARGSGRAAGSARRDGPTRAREREAWISISATRPCTSGSLGRQLGQHAPEAQRVLAQRRPHPVVAGGRRVALVEDQVDDLEHRRQPRGALVAARHLERHAAPRPASAWRGRCAGRWSARGRGTPARSRRWSGRRAGAASAPTRASVDSTGWQAVNISRSRSSPTSSSSAASRSGADSACSVCELVAELLVLALEQLARGGSGRWRGAWRWP